MAKPPLEQHAKAPTPLWRHLDSMEGNLHTASATVFRMGREVSSGVILSRGERKLGGFRNNYKGIGEFFLARLRGGMCVLGTNERFVIRPDVFCADHDNVWGNVMFFG